MYFTDSEFKSNIDGYAGEGTAEFVSNAIEVYTRKLTKSLIKTYR